jgi:nucleotide-binding universal stress UspA family protein
MTQPPAPAHILAGVDFSDGARTALDAARALAHRMNVGLVAVHVYEPLEAEGVSLDARSEQWLADSHVTPDRLQVRYGQPWVELARAASASGALAVVVGSHGRSGSQPVALGSTAARLGLVAPCPVVVVNSNAIQTREPNGLPHSPKPNRQGTK